MKAFKGCTNPECKTYKKVHYKNDDLFCPKCGCDLEYVCAKCWKVMDSNVKRLCISCSAEQEQKNAQAKEQILKKGAHVVEGLGAVAVLVGGVAKNFDAIADGTQKVVKAGSKLLKVIKK